MRHYACPKHSPKHGKVCNTKKINADYLENAIKDVLTDRVNSYMATPNTQKMVFDMLKQSKLEDVKDTQKRIAALDIHINGLIDKSINPKTSKALAERCEAQANEAIQCQNSHKERLAELQSVLSDIDKIVVDDEADDIEIVFKL